MNAKISPTKPLADDTGLPDLGRPPSGASDLISIKELSTRLGITEKAIRRKMEKGILVEGFHWFRPKGYRTIFVWRAIEKSLQRERVPEDASDGLHCR